MSYRLGRGKHTCTKVIGVGEVAMHENADGSCRTVIGDGKTPLNELPTFSGESRVGLRDTFAAAALTGLLAAPTDKDRSSEYWARFSYEIADAMLRERGNHPAKPDSSTNHDAAPAARASVGRPRTDKADLPTRCGTGETLSEAEIDALQHVVEDGRLVDLSDYGRLRSLLVRLRPEWEGSDDAAESATTPPRIGALSGCETVPDPDSRVWETPCTPQPHATPTHGSVQDEGSVPRSGTENEPVAWGVVNADFQYVSLLRESAEYAALKHEFAETVPLYRHPQPTLSDAEREAVEWCRDNLTAMAHPASAFAHIHAATLRGLLERLT